MTTTENRGLTKVEPDDARRFREDLCFTCGKEDHKKIDCPKRKEPG